MLYTEFTAGNKEYKLRLNIRSIVALERQMGMNPLSIFGDGDRMPTLTEMVLILHSALQQYNHGITLNDAYTIFEEWLADNHTITDFLPIIVDVYKVSGIIKNDGDNEKN